MKKNWSKSFYPLGTSTETHSAKVPRLTESKVKRARQGGIFLGGIMKRFFVMAATFFA
jgi:hypothetical protein